MKINGSIFIYVYLLLCIFSYVYLVIKCNFDSNECVCLIYLLLWCEIFWKIFNNEDCWELI